MNKANIRCPRYHSDKLYKFSLGKQSNQRYKCKKCKRQFAPDYISSTVISNILDVLNVAEQHIYIMNSNTIIAINMKIKIVIILSLIIITLINLLF